MARPSGGGGGQEEILERSVKLTARVKERSDLGRWETVEEQMREEPRLSQGRMLSERRMP